jgi:hypothetical protein
MCQKKIDYACSDTFDVASSRKLFLAMLVTSSIGQRKACSMFFCSGWAVNGLPELCNLSFTLGTEIDLRGDLRAVQTSARKYVPRRGSEIEESHSLQLRVSASLTFSEENSLMQRHSDFGDVFPPVIEIGFVAFRWNVGCGFEVSRFAKERPAFDDGQIRAYFTSARLIIPRECR